MVRMGGAGYGISVVRVFAPDLEDKAANRNWRPGKRYLRAMMSALMKVLFAGPSVYGLDLDLSGIVLRHPAKQGDVIAAVRDGATAIGLVDGYFGGAAAVWHKEILYALSLGVRVLGASSMGALRAAECAAYGMEPIGEVARGLRQWASRRRRRSRPRARSAGVRQPADERAAGRCASDDRRAGSARDDRSPAKPRRFGAARRIASSATGRPRRLPKVPG